MKILRHLIVLNATLLLALGFGMALFWPQSLPVVFKQYQEAATIRFLGTIVGSLGIVLFMLRNQILSDERRRLALGLSSANTLIALMALGQGIAIVWVPPLGWFLILVPLGMAAAMGWTGLRPAKLAEDAEALPIPDEVRRSWLRQIGEAAVQEERNRLARDLHDSIKQQLFTINVSAAAAQELWEQNPEKAKTVLVDVRRSAHEAMVEMQALLHQLQPRALAAAGLVEALREQCEALGYRTGADVSLELGETIPDDRLPPGAQETLFRIAQEALANVARHARPRKVRVWLGMEGGLALLRVEDDGQGFDAAAATSGMGLRNLRERAESFSGTLEILSEPGSGTTICVRVALVSPPPHPVPPVENKLKRPELQLVLLVLIFWLYRPDMDRPWLYWNLLPLVFGLHAFLLADDAKKSLRTVLAASSNVTQGVIASLRYQSHRNRALAYTILTCWASRYWRFDQPTWRAWTIFWIAAALLLAGTAIVELVRFHRTSEIRHRWLPRSWVWPAGWEQSGYSIVFVVLVGCVLGLPLAALAVRWLHGLEPVEALLFAFEAFIIAYILTRQPRTEGASA